MFNRDLGLEFLQLDYMGSAHAFTLVLSPIWISCDQNIALFLFLRISCDFTTISTSIVGWLYKVV